MSLTHIRLRQVLRYNRRTGVFTWIESAPGRKLGRRAGSSAGKNWYRQIVIDRETYLEHRLAWFYVTGRWPIHQVDHKNRIKHDNRWRNLRSATQKQNAENVNVRRHSGSGVKGVHWDSSRQKWQAYIGHRHQRLHLGRFASLKAAVAARKRAEQRLFTHAN
jgi:hypothetical protein